jgi:hypothetical protein
MAWTLSGLGYDSAGFYEQGVVRQSAWQCREGSCSQLFEQALDLALEAMGGQGMGPIVLVQQLGSLCQCLHTQFGWFQIGIADSGDYDIGEVGCTEFQSGVIDQ